MENDSYFIKKTFQLAKKAEGFTSPNPLVGAVIVKNNKIISTGYHKKCGLAHAEIEAINKAKYPLKGAILYVNLEPCCHFGRTPPCVDRIIKEGIREVVIATIDPNPQVNGKSIIKLKKAGINVRVGVCEQEARKLNEVFFKNAEKIVPFVAGKIAQSLDGKIATRRNLSKWITSESSRLFAKSLRDKYDAVLVGVNTVIKDNPRLNGFKKDPFKIIIDPRLRTPLNSNLLTNNFEKVLIFVSHKTKNNPRIKKYSAKIVFVKERKGIISLKQVLKKMYDLGIMSVLVEGGSETIGRFFDEKIIDKIYFFIALKIIGGKAALTSVGARGFSCPDKCVGIKGMNIKYLGGDILITGYPADEG